MPSAICESRVLSALVVGTLLLVAARAKAADVTVTLGSGDGFSIRDNTGAIERFRVNEATGNVSRNGALFVHTTGSTTNTFVGALAGSLSTTGTRNSAFGDRALSFNTTGQQNSAFGHLALRSNTTGIRNTAIGAYTLTNNTTGSDNSAFGNGALYANSTGVENSAVGEEALTHNTTGNTNSAFGFATLRENTGGTNNSAFGRTALVFNTTGGNNSAFGVDALRYNGNGFNSSAFGNEALRSSVAGQNSAFGHRALRANTTGNGNSAFGLEALVNNTTGVGNVAVGEGAGSNQTTGSNNIYIDNTGVAGEDGFIRIGSLGTHQRAWIQGIHGILISGGSHVYVNSNGLLGTSSPSSARFKRDIRDMADASDVLMKLRPVTFRYREEMADVPEAKTLQYGLIAEEVAAIAPELVTLDAEGKPNSVRYQLLPALMLNELQKAHEAVVEQARLNDAQLRTIEALQSRVEELEKRSAPPMAAR